MEKKGGILRMRGIKYWLYVHTWKCTMDKMDKMIYKSYHVMEKEVLLHVLENAFHFVPTLSRSYIPAKLSKSFLADDWIRIDNVWLVLGIPVLYNEPSSSKDGTSVSRCDSADDDQNETNPSYKTKGTYVEVNRYLFDIFVLLFLKFVSLTYMYLLKKIRNLDVVFLWTERHRRPLYVKCKTS